MEHNDLHQFRSDRCSVSHHWFCYGKYLVEILENHCPQIILSKQKALFLLQYKHQQHTEPKILISVAVV